MNHKPKEFKQDILFCFPKLGVRNAVFLYNRDQDLFFLELTGAVSRKRIN